MTGIYTRSGDGGDTGLFGGGRVSKDHPRVVAYGSVDELNANVGMAVVAVKTAVLRARLESIQHDLFAVGGDLATPVPTEGRKRPEIPGIPTERVPEMEAWMDQAQESLPPLREFILPGGSPGAAALHLCRTVCRRAEREVVALAAHEEVDPDIVRYLNRLSDLFFSMAREENAAVGCDDVVWRKHDGA
jgi:cob(I)alamin adenosyltransferase